ncbi:MAG: caspase family protein [Rhodobacteraceae bacterium]|nr:caspase family protein [Paracoccaceae bacterium]
MTPRLSPHSVPLVGAALAALLFTASASAQEVDCSDAAGSCGKRIPAPCLQRVGAAPIGINDGPDLKAQECGISFADYNDCLTEVVLTCAPATAAELAPRSSAPPDMMAMWELVKDSEDPFVLTSFAEEYPGTLLATIAQRQADKLTPSGTVGLGSRIALLIGNGDYQAAGMSNLPNAVDDLNRISAALEARDFRVLKYANADRATMIQAIENFESTLSVVGGVGLFYFTGLAAWIDGEDVMIPVDGAIGGADQAIIGGVNLTRLRGDIRDVTTSKLPDDGMAVLYSASEGQLALDGAPGLGSPFTRALLTTLDEGGDAEFAEMSRLIRLEVKRLAPGGDRGFQTPYLEDDRDRAFYFNDPHQDAGIGVLRLILFDSARSNPFADSAFKD